MYPALGIRRATILCNNAELVNLCKARPTKLWRWVDLQRYIGTPKQKQSYKILRCSSLKRNRGWQSGKEGCKAMMNLGYTSFWFAKVQLFFETAKFYGIFSVTITKISIFHAVLGISSLVLVSVIGRWIGYTKSGEPLWITAFCNMIQGLWFISTLKHTMGCIECHQFSALGIWK